MGWDEGVIPGSLRGSMRKVTLGDRYLGTLLTCSDRGTAAVRWEGLSRYWLVAINSHNARMRIDRWYFSQPGEHRRVFPWPGSG